MRKWYINWANVHSLLYLETTCFQVLPEWNLIFEVLATEPFNKSTFYCAANERHIKTAAAVEQTGNVLTLLLCSAHKLLKKRMLSCRFISSWFLSRMHYTGGWVHESSDQVQLYPHSLYKFLTPVWWQIVCTINPSAHLYRLNLKLPLKTSTCVAKELVKKRRALFTNKP